MNIHEIQEEYLPISRKKIRAFVKKYMPVKYIGGRIYVERELLEGILADHDREQFPLN